MSDATVEALVLLGLERDEAQAAVDHDRVALSLVGPLLEGERTVTAEQAADRLGVAVEYLVARDRALGLPEGLGYTEQEVAELAPLRGLLQVLSGEATVRNLRTDAQALTRIAMSDLQLVNAEVAEPIRREGGDDVAVALALAEAARDLLPGTITLLSSTFRRILTHLLTTEIVAAASRGTGDDVPVAVGFVDVVGYTSLSARVDPDGLDDVLEAFEARCYAVAGDHDVQLVKFLGDAAMFVSVDPAALAATLLQIVDLTDEESPLGSAPMRAGMAYGAVLPRAGDYFGPPVNLAARLTDHARPRSLLADESIRDRLDGFDTRRVPPMRLRGVGVRRPVRVRPVSPD
ncbi:MAG TPA: adenylate/guanylate cyclase domain-containing protein [Egibacteraceae bacterium]|nr:adenylate/guanylate cyclase domain-containing protein [Egibacteraceae bacterium]